MVINRSKALFEMGTNLCISVPGIVEFYQMSLKNRCQEYVQIAVDLFIWKI